MTTRTRIVACVVLALAAVVASTSVAAQEQAQQQGPPPLKLQLERGPQLGPGAMAVAEGTATGIPLRFRVEELGINQPISVVVAAANPAEPLSLALAKTGWAESFHAKTTGADGTATILVRTQGEMGIKVTSASGSAAGFMLGVWVGDEIAPETESILVPVTSYSESGGLWRWVLWIGIGVGVVLLLGMGVFIGRKLGKRGAAAVVIACLLSGALAIADGLSQPPQPQSPPGAQSGGMPSAQQIPATRVFQEPGTAPTLPGGQGPGYAPTQPGGQGPGYAPTQPGAQGPGGPGYAPTQPGGQGPGYAPTQPGGQGPGSAPTQPGGQGPGYAPTQPGGGGAAPGRPGAGTPSGSGGPATVPRGPNPVQEMPRVTPRDIEIDRQIRDNQAAAAERGRNVQRMQPGVDIPTPEQARQMVRDAEAQAAAARATNRAAGVAADRSTADSLRRGMDASRSAFQSGISGIIGATARLLAGLRYLHASDASCAPVVSPPGMPRVPSRCASDEACRGCYADAHEGLNRTRVVLEQLRCVYAQTKNTANMGMSFGDTVSPIHGVSGLAWQVERRKIEQSLVQLNQSYDAKYEQLMGRLGEDLQAINACEGQFFGDADWYNRYGFMFYTFIADRYKR